MSLSNTYSSDIDSLRLLFVNCSKSLFGKSQIVAPGILEIAFPDKVFVIILPF